MPGMLEADGCNALGGKLFRPAITVKTESQMTLRDCRCSTAEIPLHVKRGQMHGTRQSWWAVALLCGVTCALLVLALPLVPVKALGLPPYWLHISIGVGAVVTLFVLTRNPAWRYLRAYSTLVGFLVGANALPEFKLTVSIGGAVGHWLQEGVPWHLNIVLGVLAVVLMVLDYLTHRPLDERREEALETLRDKPITRQILNTAIQDEQFRRNRRQMLEKVRLNWITGFLEPSLHQLARIELGLETKQAAVERPFDLLVQRIEQAPQPIPTGMPISHIFDDSGRGLLILGEPGAGKTTLLLELTSDLLDRAGSDLSRDTLLPQ
jgi:hypothetical protein